MTSLKRITGSSAGFTLPELLVATLISFVLGAGGFLFFRSQLRSLTDQSAGLDAIEGARAALDFMASEIRTAGEDPTAAHVGGITAATATGISFSFDANGNGNATDPGEQLGYLYNSSSKLILRCTGATCSNGSSGTTLIRNASGLSFTYWLDNSATPTTTPTAAQLSHIVRVAVTVQVDAARATTVTTTTLSSNVTIRNNSTVLGYLGAT